MPKSTFFNLSEDKKERIINAAIDEFEEYTYQNASINRIVENAEIAKGSFYQYFEDKKDLFKYIIDISSEKKLKYLGDLMTNMGKLGFFEITRELYLGGIRFASELPKLSKIANEFIISGDTQLKEEILGANIPKSNKLFEGLLLKGIQDGELDPNLDVQLVAHIFTSMSVSVGEYFLKEVKSQDNMEMMKLVDKMLAFMKDGIKNKSMKNRSLGNKIEDRFY